LNASAVCRTRQQTPLPPLRWKRRSFWFSSPAQPSNLQTSAIREQGFPGQYMESSVVPHAHLWQTDLAPMRAFFDEHVVGNTAIFPAAGYLELIRLAYAERRGDGRELMVRDFVLAEALVIAPEGSGSAPVMQTAFQPQSDGTFQFTVSSLSRQRKWQVHATGSIGPASMPREIPFSPSHSLEPIDAEDHYIRARQWQIHYGERFRCLREIQTGSDEACARIVLPSEANDLPAPLARIAWLDSALQVIQAMRSGTCLPVRIAQIYLARCEAEPARVHAISNSGAESVSVWDDHGQVMIRMEGIELHQSDGVPPAIYRFGWENAAALKYTGRPVNRCALAGKTEISDLLTEALQAHGSRVASPTQSSDERSDALLLSGESAQDAEIALALARQSVERDPATAIWFVTRGAQGPDRHITRPTGGLLWGLRRVFVNEYPNAAIGIADIEDARDADVFAADLVLGVEPDEVVYREGRRLKCTSHKSRVPSRESLWLSQDASYLITGGWGGLGIATAAWLIRRGAGAITLVGRSAPDNDTESHIAALGDGGTRILTMQADVGSRLDMERVLAEVRRQMPVLRGIFHAAGHLQDGMIAGLDLDSFRNVLEPKYKGTLILHELTRDLPLDYFVLYSSIASLIGSPGQASHASANSFLDAFAAYRRGLGLAALSVNWGPWLGSGRVSREGREAELRERGLPLLSPNLAFRALDQLLAEGNARAGVFALDPARWRYFHPHSKMQSFLTSTPDGLAEQGAASTAVLHLPPGQAGTRAVESLVANEAAKVLHISSSLLDYVRPLREYGLDSLRSFELRNRLEAALEIRVPAIAIWRHSSVQALAEYCRGNHLNLTRDAVTPLEQTATEFSV
jgi:NAD(P)-dependent dehydrogenase (short-subunit alcohol dehydrogenase family)/acyl carrier protein